MLNKLINLTKKIPNALSNTNANKPNPIILIVSNVTNDSAFNVDAIVRPNNNVKNIYRDVFEGCSIEKVYFHGTLEEWENIEFESYASNPLHAGGKLYINNELVEDPSVYPYI